MARASREAKAAFWRAHLRTWRVSGLSQAAYCRLHGLSLKSMNYRNRTLSLDFPAEEGDSSTTGNTKATPAITFVPVPLPRGPAGVGAFAPLQVVLGERLRIRVDGDFDPALLMKLIRTLEALA